ncbi:MAG: PilZ domain-containing protein [bacterium]
MREGIISEGTSYNNYSERREGLRFKAKANCSFRSFDSSAYNNENDVYRIKNIGTGGLAFLCDQKCKLKDRLLFTIAFRDTYAEEPINAVGEVTWINCSESNEKYCIGVKFINMLKDDLLNLTRTLH